MALLGAAFVHDLNIFHGPISSAVLVQTTTPASSKAWSPFSVASNASTRLTQANSSFVEVPGCINDSLLCQGIGYSQYSVS